MKEVGALCTSVLECARRVAGCNRNCESSMASCRSGSLFGANEFDTAKRSIISRHCGSRYKVVRQHEVVRIAVMFWCTRGLGPGGCQGPRECPHVCLHGGLRAVACAGAWYPRWCVRGACAGVPLACRHQRSHPPHGAKCTHLGSGVCAGVCSSLADTRAVTRRMAQNAHIWRPMTG